MKRVLRNSRRTSISKETVELVLQIKKSISSMIRLNITEK